MRLFKVHAKNLAILGMAAASISAGLGCSKGGGSDSSPAAPAATPAPAPAKPAEKADPNAATAGKPTASTGAPDKKAAPAATDKTAADKDKNNTDNKPGSGEVVMNPTGMTPDEIYAASDKLGQTQPGIASPITPFVFSTAGQDHLHEQLKAVVDAVTDKAQATLNQKLARDIGFVNVDFDGKNHNGTVHVGITDSSGKQTRQDLSATMGKDLALHTGTAKKELVVDATCMDDNNNQDNADIQCHTVHVKISRTQGKKTAVAHVIARQTNAYLYINGNPPGTSNNPRYDALMNILLNTVYHPNAPGGVEGLRFVTSEVIDGGSEYSVAMYLGVRNPVNTASQGQLLTLSGLLIKPAASDDVGTDAEVTPSDKREIAGQIRQAILQKNDGRANLQFDLVMRATNATSNNEDTIHLTVARIHHDVRSLEN